MADDTGGGQRHHIIPSSALATCPHFILAAGHWSHYEVDGKCNCGRLCGFSDADGGPCILPVDNHPRRARGGQLVHDDGRRNEKNAWRR